MPFMQRLLLSYAGAFFVCDVLFLLSGFPISPDLMCCGFGMDFPFLCLGVLLSLLSVIALLSRSRHKQGVGVPSPPVSKKLLKQLGSLFLSDFLHGWFFASLLLSMALLLVGAALLFSLSLSFAWSTLALGCFNVLNGLGVLFMGGYRLHRRV